MAERPVFVPGRKGGADVFWTEFEWNKGLNAAQKKKNVAALHEAFQRRFPEKRVLEISTKSSQELGGQLSAFHLKKHVPSMGRSIPLECAFQGGKVFGAGGPYLDLYTASPRDAKRDTRLRESGMLRGFFFEGAYYPIEPRTAFYNWLYINALLENPELGKQLLEYDGFTDIEFNPNKSSNCQAEAAAVYVGLARRGQLEQSRDFQMFLSFL